MGQCRDLDKLDARFRPIVDYIIKTAKLAYKEDLKVIETLRTQVVQTAYYAQGREPLNEVNIKRVSAGLYTIDADTNKKIITNVKKIDKTKSHAAGLAVDFMPQEGYQSSTTQWNIIGKCVELAKKLFDVKLQEMNAVIVWGGDWKMKDMPHVELIFGKEEKIV
jgi:hypothetical protein